MTTIGRGMPHGLGLAGSRDKFVTCSVDEGQYMVRSMDDELSQEATRGGDDMTITQPEDGKNVWMMMAVATGWIHDEKVKVGV